MSESTPARPRQVSLAGWLVVLGSGVVVLMALGQAAQLHSLDTREAVTDFLSRPPGDQLGMGVQDGLTVLRVGATVAAVSAAASAVLGWYAMRRSTGARLALTLLAAPLFLSGFFLVTVSGAGMVTAMVTAAIVMLWFQPSRDWFRGIRRVVVVVPGPPPRPAGRDPLLDLPPPSGPPLHAVDPSYLLRPVQPPAERPRSVAWACAITWVSTATVFVVFGLTLLQLLTAPDQVVTELRRQNPDLTMSAADLRLATGLLCGVLMAWSAAAAGLAVLVWRRKAWAAVALAVSAFAACATLLPLVAAAGALLLLARADSRAWLRG